MADDEAVKSTSDEAALCKRFAAEKGYWRDDFIRYFCSKPGRKSPEISRGYYARVVAIETVIRQFISLCHESKRKCHVISLGAGSDTTFWRLSQELKGSTHGKVDCYIEVDFPDVAARKCHVIKSKEALQRPLLNAVFEGDEIHSQGYHLISGDLRNMEGLSSKVHQIGIDTSEPCLVLTECVLVYLKPEYSNKVISWAGGTFPTSMFLNYDPISLKDEFGSIMKENVKARGCAFYGLESCPDLESHRQRYLSNHWSHASTLNMNDVYRFLPQEDRQRIERLEFFDEKELLVQLLLHYCLSWSANDSLGIGMATLGLQSSD